MSMVKTNNYITIQGWMITDIGLKGNDLMVYAVIYGFTQDGKSTFKGSRQYLADWCNSTVRGIQKNLNSLIEKGLLVQVVHTVDNYVEYMAVNQCEQSSQEVLNNVPKASAQSSLPAMNKVPNPNEQSAHNNLIDNIEEDKLKEKNTYVQNFTKAYSEICVSLPKIRTLTDKRKKAIIKLYKKYSEEDIMLVLKKAEESDFLAGRAKEFKADLDWILNENNFVKILEGRYDNRKASYNKKFAEYNVKSTQVTEEEIANGYFTGQVY